MSHIRQISNEDNDKIIKLLHKSFGPGRFARSVYRLREKNDRDTEFSYIYELNNQILSSISYYKTFLNNDTIVYGFLGFGLVGMIVDFFLLYY